MPLNQLFRQCTGCYKLTKLQEMIYHLMYMDDIELFAKNEKYSETLIHTIRIYIPDIGIEFGIEKCAKTNKKTNNGMDRTTKPRKNKNVWKKGNLQVVGKIRSRHHQTSWDEKNK